MMIYSVITAFVKSTVYVCAVAQQYNHKDIGSYAIVGQLTLGNIKFKKFSFKQKI